MYFLQVCQKYIGFLIFTLQDKDCVYNYNYLFSFADKSSAISNLVKAFRPYVEQWQSQKIHKEDLLCQMKVQKSEVDS